MNPLEEQSNSVNKNNPNNINKQVKFICISGIVTWIVIFVLFSHELLFSLSNFDSWFIRNVLISTLWILLFSYLLKNDVDMFAWSFITSIVLSIVLNGVSNSHQSILILIVFGIFIYIHMYKRKFNLDTVYWASHTLLVIFFINFIYPYKIVGKLLLTGVVFSIFVTYYTFKPFMVKWGNNVKIEKRHIYLGYVLLPVVGGILLQREYNKKNKSK